MQNALQKVLQVHFLPAGFPMQIHFCISKNLGSARVGILQNRLLTFCLQNVIQKCKQKYIFASATLHYFNILHNKMQSIAKW